MFRATPSLGHTTTLLRRAKLLLATHAGRVKVAGGFLLLALLASAAACSGSSTGSPAAQQTSSADIAQLQQQVANLQAVAPGPGEIMLSFQTHIAKVWFAGENGNWDLAKFETGEIVEGIDGVKASRPATGPMLDTFNTQILAQLSKAIEAKDKTQFETAYKQTVGYCNSCHANYKADSNWPQGRPFIKITIPTQPPESNQQWTP